MMIRSAVLLAAAALLTACHGVQHNRVGLASGVALADFGATNEAGAYGAARAEVATTLDANSDRIEVGGRLTLGGRGFDQPDNPSFPNTDFSSQAFDLQTEAVFRLYANDVDANVRPFVEAFGGLAFQNFELESVSSGVESSAFDSAFGPTVGGAFGLEFPLEDGMNISVGGEVRYSTFDFDDFGDAYTEYLDVGAFVNVGFRL